MFEQFGNLMEMVKKLQQNVNEVQEKLKEERIVVTSGDALTVTMNGQQDLVTIELNPKYLSPENAPLLQDLLVATINNAVEKSREISQSAVGQLSSDLNIPKIPGLF
ncbi:MAG: YbaB/EbfC family nucleoid-associated protein [Sporomusaceae bacterium]|nr:YbaB/EbfC family nucleoid-associated protein [Sporomusaceae bacterium]